MVKTGVLPGIAGAGFGAFGAAAELKQGIVQDIQASRRGQGAAGGEELLLLPGESRIGDILLVVLLELRFFATRSVTLPRGSLSVQVPVEAETEGSRYNVPVGQINKSLTYLGAVSVTNAADWITREGSDREDDEALRQRTLRSWAELGERATEDSFVNAAEAVPGVMFAQADCDHPRGQGTVDVIVTGTAGEATEELLEAVRAAVEDICGPYDNILVKSSIAVSQDIHVVVTTTDTASDEEITAQITRILTELLAVKKGRKLHELYVSDINYAVRSGHSAATNAAVMIPAQDVILERDKVITLGAVTVEVRRA